jgi:SAM-dependent methyltransferase
VNSYDQLETKGIAFMKADRFRRTRRQLWNWIRSFLPLRTQKGAARFLPEAYLRGDGLEIGALADPLRIPPGARVQYVDRFSVEDLRKHYPTLKTIAMVPVDIVTDGERLTGVDDESRDFVIARHFLEHCQDPIGTLKHLFRVLRPGGIVYFAVPDKRYTFDRDRPVTSLSHLFEDHRLGPEQSRRAHFEEYVRFTEYPATEDQLQKQTDEMMARDYSIHFHVWTQHEVLELLLALRTQIGFEIETFCKNRNENICVLRKDPSLISELPASDAKPRTSSRAA